MKIKDWGQQHWDIFGKFQAVMIEVVGICRECCSAAHVGPQFLFWLANEGKQALIDATVGLIVRWKVEYEASERNNRIHFTKVPDFMQLYRECDFEGKYLVVNGENFPSRGLEVGVDLCMKEVAIPTAMDTGEVVEFISKQSLWAANPLEYLMWLKVNPDAGFATSIICAVEGEDGNFMWCTKTGPTGYRRSICINKPDRKTGKWPVTSVFLCVEVKK